MHYIYSRVSTDGQTTDNQITNLKAKFPGASVVSETASGAKSRPKLEHLITALKQGDTLIVAALDRLGRRTSEVLVLIERLQERGINLISDREGIDYSTAVGRLVTQILVSVAEMERAMISERTKAALKAKRAIGIVGGRPSKVSHKMRAKMQELRDMGWSFARIGKALGVSDVTVLNHLGS